MTVSFLEAALAYGATDCPVFPLQPYGKKPAVKRGFYAATTNPETIRRFWRITENNIGIPTGPASGLWVLDIDPGGEDQLDILQREHGPLPPTRQVRTPRGGSHYYFRYTGPVEVSHSATELGAMDPADVPAAHVVTASSGAGKELGLDTASGGTVRRRGYGADAGQIRQFPSR